MRYKEKKSLHIRCIRLWILSNPFFPPMKYMGCLNFIIAGHAFHRIATGKNILHALILYDSMAPIQHLSLKMELQEAGHFALSCGETALNKAC